MSFARIPDPAVGCSAKDLRLHLIGRQASANGSIVAEEQQQRARWRIDNATDLTYEEYLHLVGTESTTSNGVSGVKLHYYQFAELPKRMEAVPGLRELTSGQLMLKIFPKATYIWLRRRDKARQAISLQLASKTDKWWALDEATTTKGKGKVSTPQV